MAATILQACRPRPGAVAGGGGGDQPGRAPGPVPALGRAGRRPFPRGPGAAGPVLPLRGEEGLPLQRGHRAGLPLSGHRAGLSGGGADAISCLTEPKWFLGSDQIFREIRGAVSLPMLRKDFTVDEYQLYQARLMGADCVLLICALLDTDELARYLGICEELGLDALAEAHDAGEIASAVSAGAKIIGVNNRNLKDFSVDFSNAARAAGSDPAGGALRGGKRRARPGRTYPP